jgi:ankyrin repeat protein
MCVSSNKRSVHATTPMKDTPLIWAAEMGSTECVQMLLDARADPNELEIDGWSAVHWAARNGHLDLAILPLEHNERLYHQNRKGYTPLDWAVDREHWMWQISLVNGLPRMTLKDWLTIPTNRTWL